MTTATMIRARPQRVGATLVGNGEHQAQMAQQQSSPFGPEFQGMLFRLLVEDGRFAAGVSKDLDASFFSYAPFAWGWNQSRAYVEQYSVLPSYSYLLDLAMRTLGPQGPIFAQALHTSRTTNVTDEQWLRDKTLDWIRRSIFRRAYHDVKAIFDQGDVDAAYDWMQTELEKVRGVSWANPDRSFYAEEFQERHAVRKDLAERGGGTIPTGVPLLDRVLEGGAVPGFLGTFIAYPKAGKTTTLINFGFTAFRLCRRPSIHFVFEGSRQMVEARYDTLFLDELYQNVKRGDVDNAKYAAAVDEMQSLKRLLVIRGFTDTWDASVTNIDQELRDLRTTFGFKPEMCLLDYADLVKGRKAYDNDYAEQRAVYQDLKTIAKRAEMAIWTASQVTRPKNEDFDVKEHLLKSKDIAECYSKVRIADFIGSINQTVAERDAKQMRLYAELFRDGAAHTVIPVSMDFSRMGFRTDDGASQGLPPGHAPPPGFAPPPQVPQLNGVSKPFGYGAYQVHNGV